MERTRYEKANERLNVIASIAERLGYEYQIVEEENIEIPTILIATEKDYKDDDVVVSCNLLPMELGGIEVQFLQYYTCIVESIPEDKKEVITEFIRRQNDGFMIGNMLEFMDSVCIKYSLYLDPDVDLDEIFFARTLDIFTFEADILNKKINDLISGEITLEDALQTGAFFGVLPQELKDDEQIEIDYEEVEDSEQE